MTSEPALALPIYWVDAFTTQAFSGNAAVVVPDAVGLTVNQMQQLAREVNCSETAFIFPATDPQADLELRWFTPTQEIDFCGHATVAAMQVFNTFNTPQSPETPRTLNLQTRIGVVPVTLETNLEGETWIWLTVPAINHRPIAADLLPELFNGLGLPQLAQRPALLPVVDSLNHDLLVMVESLAQLQQLQPNLDRLGSLGQTQGWRGICPYTTETVMPESAAHLRFFAPHCGIPEDPVTGSVSVPLVTHLLAQGKLPLGQLFTLEQGDCLGRAGRVRVDLNGSQPRFGGQAVTVIQGKLHLPRQNSRLS